MIENAKDDITLEDFLHLAFIIYFESFSKLHYDSI